MMIPLLFPLSWFGTDIEFKLNILFFAFVWWSVNYIIIYLEHVATNYQVHLLPRTILSLWRRLLSFAGKSVRFRIKVQWIQNILVDSQRCGVHDITLVVILSEPYQTYCLHAFRRSVLKRKICFFEGYIISICNDSCPRIPFCGIDVCRGRAKSRKYFQPCFLCIVFTDLCPKPNGLA